MPPAGLEERPRATGASGEPSSLLFLESEKWQVSHRSNLVGQVTMVTSSRARVAAGTFFLHSCWLKLLLSWEQPTGSRLESRGRMSLGPPKTPTGKEPGRARDRLRQLEMDVARDGQVKTGGPPREQEGQAER